MGEKFHSSKPIYLQIIDKIHYQIVRGELRKGEKLPSVREMAIQMGVNPNTIQRTYTELERMNVVETRRGQGTFVTENQMVIADLTSQLQHSMIEQFVWNMKELGLQAHEIKIALETYLEEEKK